MSDSMTSANPKRPIILKNCVCVYCGEPRPSDQMTKEHVVGRRFVPKGTLDGNWNLIVGACERCNGEKSDLEDDISAITMLPDVTGQYAHDEAQIVRIAERKASGAISRHTGRLVGESREELTLKSRLGADISMSFGFIGHPHIDDERAFRLARMQLTAFFFWISYDSGKCRGYYWPDGFHPVMLARKEDWGNARIIAFADAVKTWQPRISATTAEGFFKLAMRRHPTAACWSWAIEWNRTARLIGFVGDQTVAEEAIASLPQLDTKVVSQGPSLVVRLRPEQALDPSKDQLFAFSD